MSNVLCHSLGNHTCCWPVLLTDFFPLLEVRNLKFVLFDNWKEGISTGRLWSNYWWGIWGINLPSFFLLCAVVSFLCELLSFLLYAFFFKYHLPSLIIEGNWCPNLSIHGRAKLFNQSRIRTRLIYSTYQQTSNLNVIDMKHKSI